MKGATRPTGLVVLLAISSVAWAHGGGTPGTVDAASGRPLRSPGAVEGTVHLDVGAPTEPAMLNPYARRRYRPPSPSPSAPGSPTHVVVWLVADSATAPAGTLDARVVQRNRTILPHVTAVRAGTRVHFPNEDDVFHNLFSLSEPHAFNLGRYPPGESRSERFEEPGVVRIFCDIHSDMGGVLLVLDSPWFTRPDEDGTYRLTGIPPGRHRVVAWHESAGSDTAFVEVTDQGVARADFRLGGAP